jgi:hypothetical protein
MLAEFLCEGFVPSIETVPILCQKIRKLSLGASKAHSGRKRFV